MIPGRILMVSPKYIIVIGGKMSIEPYTETVAETPRYTKFGS
jgi:hypothetical protein